MDSEATAKLKTLLAYWIEHNGEHAGEFREWAGTTMEMGKAEVAEALLKAVVEMDKAGELLAEARDKLEG
jgi:hypothetical protein